MPAKVSSKYGKPRHGAVGIVVEDSKFLVIRRSAFVRAPNMICFPGGTIETGETPEQAVVRELAEELHLTVDNPKLIWQSRTSWGTLLDWLVVDRLDSCDPVANEREVAEFMWVSGEKLLERSDLLGSMPDFLALGPMAFLNYPPARARRPPVGNASIAKSDSSRAGVEDAIESIVSVLFGARDMQCG